MIDRHRQTTACDATLHRHAAAPTDRVDHPPSYTYPPDSLHARLSLRASSPPPYLPSTRTPPRPAASSHRLYNLPSASLLHAHQRASEARPDQTGSRAALRQLMRPSYTDDPSRVCEASAVTPTIRLLSSRRRSFAAPHQPNESDLHDMTPSDPLLTAIDHPRNAVDAAACRTATAMRVYFYPSSLPPPAFSTRNPTADVFLPMCHARNEATDRDTRSHRVTDAPSAAVQRARAGRSGGDAMRRRHRPTATHTLLMPTSALSREWRPARRCDQSGLSAADTAISRQRAPLCEVARLSLHRADREPPSWTQRIHRPHATSNLTSSAEAEVAAAAPASTRPADLQHGACTDCATGDAHDEICSFFLALFLPCCCLWSVSARSADSRLGPSRRQLQLHPTRRGKTDQTADTSRPTSRHTAEQQQEERATRLPAHTHVCPPCSRHVGEERAPQRVARLVAACCRCSCIVQQQQQQRRRSQEEVPRPQGEDHLP